MDYEKAYKEALAWMRELYPGLHGATKEDAEHYFPELRESEDERIRKEINTLYSEIDTCISELLEARTDKDSEAEGKALFKMEGLMVATLQDLSCIEDYLEKQKEDKDELVYRLNGLMQDYIKEGKDDEEKEHRLKCYQLFWDALEDTNFFEQKEQKPAQTDDEKEYIRTIKSVISDFIRDKKPKDVAYYQRIYNWLDGRHIEQKPAEKEITLNGFEKVLDSFLFDFVHSPIIDCEPKEYIKNHSAYLLKAAYKELNAQLKQDFFEAQQEGRREGYEAAMAEQKPAEWSEDDESFYDSIMCEVIKEGMHPTPAQANWFKSLPERFNLKPHRKPSKEQEEPEYYQHFDPDC